LKDQFYVNFPNVGFFGATVSDDELKAVKDEMLEIQQEFSLADPIRLGHACNLKQEYHLKKCLPDLEKIVIPLVNEYRKIFNFDDHSDRQFKLTNAWINFQKKHEHFQNHTHRGTFSFAMWLQVPFLIEDEIKFCSQPNYTVSTTATFNFHYTDALGRINTWTIPVDKTYENKIALFPGSMTHSVNPFYSSDEYRISVSGNIDYV
jgi:hypothetical protein